MLQCVASGNQFGLDDVYLIASYGSVGGRWEEFPMLFGAVPTCHRGRKVAKTKFVIKHLNLETAGDYDA